MKYSIYRVSETMKSRLSYATLELSGEYMTREYRFKLKIKTQVKNFVEVWTHDSDHRGGKH